LKSSDQDTTREPAPLGDVLSGLLGRRPLASGVLLGRLSKRWTEVVGERLAPETAPARFDSGALVVAATSGPWGAQAKFLESEIRKRANEVLGGEHVRQVRVTVGAVNRNARKPL
jgi:predicted nucleic acid-binding Zn ribbon protein